jgi:tRNA(fMet)-specific endonuclease VapC
MPRYMLDSCFCIDLMRDKTQGLRERFREEWGNLCLSTIVLHELQYGAEKSALPAHNLIKVEDFTTRFQICDFDASAASHAAQIRANLAMRGCQIGAYDALIAGHARSLNLTVVTSNLKEFTRVDGLRCEDWLAEEKAQK